MGYTYQMMLEDIEDSIAMAQDVIDAGNAEIKMMEDRMRRTYDEIKRSQKEILRLMNERADIIEKVMNGDVDLDNNIPLMG